MAEAATEALPTSTDRPPLQGPLYEGLFLLNQQAMAGDLQKGLDHVREILDRAEAQTLVLRKWDERKLAYEIQGQKRGVFILAYFHARPTMLPNIERDCNLSDMVMRSLVLKAEHVGETELELARREEDKTRGEARLRRAEREEESADDLNEDSSVDDTAGDDSDSE